jgi:hypothetical protein
MVDRFVLPSHVRRRVHANHPTEDPCHTLYRATSVTWRARDAATSRHLAVQEKSSAHAKPMCASPLGVPPALPGWQ